MDYFKGTWGVVVVVQGLVVELGNCKGGQEDLGFQGGVVGLVVRVLDQGICCDRGCVGMVGVGWWRGRGPE